MPLRIPKTVLPPLPPFGDEAFEKSFDLWRLSVSDILTRNFQEIESVLYRDAFIGIRLSSATIATGTPTAIDLLDETVDTAQMHSTSDSPSQVFIKTSGIHAVAGHIPFKGASTAGTFRQAAIWGNGLRPVVEQTVPVRQAGGYQTINCSGYIKATAGGFLQLVANHDAGVNVGIGGSTSIVPTLAVIASWELPPPL